MKFTTRFLVCFILALHFILPTQASANPTQAKMKFPLAPPAPLDHSKYLKMVNDMAREEVRRGGLPFATVIVNRQGQVVAQAVNIVGQTHDITDHAETRALKILSQKIKSTNIEGHTVYAISHPCPMCLSALMMAKPDEVVFGLELPDKERALGRKLNNPNDLYHQISKDYRQRHLKMTYVEKDRDEAVAIFKGFSRAQKQKP